jgi:hypothetical protein
VNDTVTTAPTEEEIRAAIARQWGVRPPNPPSIEIQFSDGIGATMRLLDGLFGTEDFRDSELERLDELVEGAVDPIRDDARRRINEALVATALTFAAEHPDAPRAPKVPAES